MKKILSSICLILVLMICMTGCSQAATATSTSPDLPNMISPLSATAQQNPQAVNNMLDGRTDSWYYMTYWQSKNGDDIPDVTFNFANSTITEIWIRNGCCQSSNKFNANAALKKIRITFVTSSGNKEYEYTMANTFDLNRNDASWHRGYQKLEIPQPVYGVSAIYLWSPGVRKGKSEAYNICISDIVFCGSNDPHYVPPVVTPVPVTPVPITPVPVTPVPATPTPFVIGQPVSVVLNQSLTGYAGPGNFYEDLGSFLKKGNTVNALSRAYDDVLAKWYVQIEFRNSSKVMTRAYVDSATLRKLDINLLKEENCIRSGVIVTDNCIAYRGPGDAYGYYTDMVPYNTITDVYAEENNFSQIEIYNDTTFKSVRVWVPSYMLR